VHDAGVVQGGHARDELGETGAQALLAAGGADVVEEMAPLHQVHGEEPARAVGRQLVQADQVRVHEVRDRAELALEALHVGGEATALRLERLEREATAELDVLDLVHDPEAALPQARKHAIARGAGERGELRRPRERLQELVAGLVARVVDRLVFGFAHDR
jgi:hypothetical protein